jgi:lysophospholipase L1-like esterase
VDRVWPKLGDVLLVLLAVVVGAAAVAVSLGYGLRDAPATADSLAPVPSTSASPDTTEQVQALFLGGSVVAGASRTPGTPSFAEVAAVQLGWRAEVDGRQSAGLTVGGPRRLTELLPADLDEPKPDVVVVQGGESDTVATPAEVRAAVAELAATLRESYGLTTRLVLVGPYSPVAEPSDEIVAVRDAMRTAAKAASLHFFDPLESAWVSASDPGGLVDGGTRLPTSDGHLKIGRLLAASLETLKVVPSAG